MKQLIILLFNYYGEKMKNKNLNICLSYSLNTINNKSLKTQLKNIDIIIMPEMILGGYSVFKEEKNFFITKDEPFIQSLLNFTKENKILLFPGTFPIGHSHKDRKNVSLALYNGKIINEYEKIHLFKPLNEHKLFKPGKYTKNFTVNLRGNKVKVGNIICFDLRFPELARKRAKEDMDLLIVQAWWPKEREEIWKTLLKARSIENQTFVIGVNSKNDIHCGKSYVFDPFGNEVKFTKVTKEYEICSIDLSLINSVKKIFDNIKSAKLINDLCK